MPCTSATSQAQRSPARLLDLCAPLLGICEGQQLGSQAKGQPSSLATSPTALSSLPGPAAAGLLLGHPPPQGASHGRLGPKGPLLPPLYCYVVQRSTIATLSLQQRGPELLPATLCRRHADQQPNCTWGEGSLLLQLMCYRQLLHMAACRAWQTGSSKVTHLLVFPAAVNCTIAVQEDGVAVSQGNGRDCTAPHQRLHPACMAPLHGGGASASAKPDGCEAYAPPAAGVMFEGLVGHAWVASRPDSIGVKPQHLAD